MTRGEGSLDVSRETSSRLDLYEALLRKWNSRINLVSRASLPQLRSRHIADSVQVYRLAPRAQHWVDLGSGGGFPGLVAAILALGDSAETRFTLIESDRRKAAFLRTVIRETGVNAGVISQRIEEAAPQKADVLTARALADLPVLLDHAARHLAPDGTALFPKGVTWKKELEHARQRWRFRAEVIESATQPGAAILKIKGAMRV